MAAVLGPLARPSRSARPRNELLTLFLKYTLILLKNVKIKVFHGRSARPPYKKCPSDLRNMPIRPTKNAHPTYEKCPSDLRKMPIRPTKSAHLTYKIEWPSDSYN